jgi:hypothetical protein
MGSANSAITLVHEGKNIGLVFHLQGVEYWVILVGLFG